MEAEPIQLETPKDNLIDPIDAKMIDINIFDIDINNKKFQLEYGKSENNKNIIFKVKESNINLVNSIYSLTLNINELHNISTIFTLYQNIDEIYIFLLDIIKSKKYSVLLKENKIVLIFQISMPGGKIIDINFDLNEVQIKKDDLMRQLNSVVNELLEENKSIKNDIKNKNNELENVKNSYNNLANENVQIKNKLKNIESLELKNEINELKKENIELRKITNYQNDIINQLKEQMKSSSKKDYCLFHNNLKYITQIYNISKFPLPHNCEVVIHFTKVYWVRVGITLDKEIINKQKDYDNPKYDIYYILQDLQRFYTLKEHWKNIFKGNNIGLQEGDNLTMILKNGIIKYSINGKELEGSVKINFNDKKDIYLLVHRRDEDSQCEIKSINEIFD